MIRECYFPTYMKGFFSCRSDDYSIEEGYDIERAGNRRTPSRNRNHGKGARAQLNPIDACWVHTNWRNNRRALAKCALGFGKYAIGGAYGPIYVVTDNSDEDLVNPKKGTLRYGVLKDVSASRFRQIPFPDNVD